jgi:hypothetical protein
MTTPRRIARREPVRWIDLKPEEFLRRLAERPVAYLPMGMVEPHGHAAAFGLDLIKAEFLCDEAAARSGGSSRRRRPTTSTRPASTAPGSRRSSATSTRGSAAYRRTW